ncbi:hypothetical protein F9U39_15660 [Pectobacterium versatile]|uniref:Uncharacterized protein n=2 Tax=Pectobacterium TaxID=122277 RepID=A0AAW3SW87_9GAMM|nr:MULTISPECIES: hypothetical protein [Pectobacterium]MBA5204775.1 hypothetical protein [Pectobacterium aroidearum]MBN3176365.1 hypothetical protein [Pectobacterium parmentieri]MBQ4790865.1 hypothetical protein [Pectobacterium versatile]QHQ23438.1 hypothetical protein GMX10_04620 [Pectobacterium parvum]QRN28963.1 hypothetical protein IG623_16745 [Pectobacterium parmentieri]
MTKKLIWEIIKLIASLCLFFISLFVLFSIIWSIINMKTSMATSEDIARVIKEYPCAKTEFEKILEKEPLLTSQAEDIGQKCQAIERQKNALE